MSISDRLKKARAALGLTQKELCSLTGIPLPSLRGYELSHRTPGGDAIEALSRAGINANWLLTGEGPMLLTDRQAPTESPHAPPPGHREVAGEGGFSVPDGFDHVPLDDERYPLRLLIESEDTSKLPDYMSAGPGRMLLPFYPSMTTRLSQALANVYGASYSKLKEEDQTHLFQRIYGVLCQLGADETAVPRVEEIEAVAKLAIRLRGAPAPAQNTESTNPNSKESEVE